MDISNIPLFQKGKVRFFIMFITNISHKVQNHVHNFQSVISSG